MGEQMPMTPSVMQARAEFKKQKARENRVATAVLIAVFIVVGGSVFSMLTGGLFPSLSLPTSSAALLTALVLFTPLAILFVWACWRTFVANSGNT
jgi:protein-S-isoprenylcysteine O-methyltransferase Ste14